MDIVIKKSNTLAEIFDEVKDDKELQEIKITVSIEVPINGAVFNNGIEEIKNKSASSEAEEECCRRLKEAIGEIGIDLLKNIENV